MPGEHVVAAGANSSHRHAGARPDGVSLAEAPAPISEGFRVRVRVVARRALEVAARHAQRRDQHRDTAQQEHSARQRKESTQQYESRDLNMSASLLLL